MSEAAENKGHLTEITRGNEMIVEADPCPRNLFAERNRERQR